MKKEQYISDGSTANYYKLPSNATELQDLISFKNMNAQIGEIFRSCFRYGECNHSDQLRDAKKMKFYAEAEIERLKNLDKDISYASKKEEEEEDDGKLFLDSSHIHFMESIHESITEEILKIHLDAIDIFSKKSSVIYSLNRVGKKLKESLILENLDNADKKEEMNPDELEKISRLKEIFTTVIEEIDWFFHPKNKEIFTNQGYLEETLLKIITVLNSYDSYR